MNSKQKRALKQFKELEKLAKDLRLAADGWESDWQMLIAILMSARTTDKKTIPVAEGLFKKYDSIEKISKASLNDVENLIRPVNFYKTKARHIMGLANIIIKDYHGNIPHDFNKLVELPGVGRKTANVFLSQKGHGTIGVDTHVAYCSQRLGWTKHSDQYKVEQDLQKLFPERMWGKLNWVLVRFGQTYPNRRIKDEILNQIKRIK